MGNVLAVVLDRKTGYGLSSGNYVGYSADLASVTDYYPFGMPMPGRNLQASWTRFGYNAKENDDEVYGEGSFQDYGFRMYNSLLGRFISVDPLTFKYPYYTPYQFAGNMPIQFIDLDGLEPANNPKTPGAKEKAAMATVDLIETGAGRNSFETNTFSRGGWFDSEIKGKEFCTGGGKYKTDTDPPAANSLNLYVSNNNIFEVDESQASRFNNYESFIVSTLVKNFKQGTGAENYNFPTNGIISSKFFKSEIFNAALKDYNSGTLPANESRQYSFGLSELGGDFMKNGLWNIVGMVGSASITFTPTEKGVRIKIFNVTSLSSGAYIKNPKDLKTFPNSYVRDPNKKTPYGNISQTFNLFISNDSPLLKKE